MNRDRFYKLLKKIPKAEIHLHSEAIISKKTAMKIISRKYPEYKSKEAIDRLFNYNSLEEFISVFLKIQESFKEIDDFNALFNDIKNYLKDNGIIYGELFFAPSFFIKNGWDFKELMNFIIKKIRAIKRNYHITIKILVDVSRTFGPENAEHNLDLLLSYLKENNCPEIIGIGLGGDEQKGPAKSYESVFKRAGEHNLHLVAHAGEDVGPESVWDALNCLKAERIGHGISSMEDEKLLDYLKERAIPLEICPTSNVFTRKYVQKLENHPIRELYDRGIFVTVNTDDPTFFSIDLIGEYWNLYSKLNFSLNDIKRLIINGFEASFLSKKSKEKAEREINKLWEKYIKADDI